MSYFSLVPRVILTIGGCLVNEPSSFQSCCRIRTVKYLSVTLPLSELGNRLLVNKWNVPEVPDGAADSYCMYIIRQLYLPRQQDDWSERGSKPQKRFRPREPDEARNPEPGRPQKGVGPAQPSPAGTTLLREDWQHSLPQGGEGFPSTRCPGQAALRPES